MALAILKLDTYCLLVARANGSHDRKTSYTCDDCMKRRRAVSSDARRLGLKIQKADRDDRPQEIRPNWPLLALDRWCGVTPQRRRSRSAQEQRPVHIPRWEPLGS